MFWFKGGKKLQLRDTCPIFPQRMQRPFFFLKARVSFLTHFACFAVPSSVPIAVDLTGSQSIVVELLTGFMLVGGPEKFALN